MADQERIQKILDGDLKEFQGLIEDYQRLVCHVVFRMVLNEADREEICQEVFLKLYQNLNKFEFKSKLSTWIARIAYNTAINYLKKKKVPLYDDIVEDGGGDSTSSTGGGEGRHLLEEVAGSFEPPDEFLINQEVSQFLHTQINELPLQYRTILTLYHLDELSYKDIGEIMNLPQGTVKSYLFRARKLLKERMLEKYPAEELW